ncbi:hypothetical protein ACFSC6_11050 [Rufibacter sediminis]|uniref:Lipocalin-like domain-containing protein n=1 Tax=Rufibacter sediminis TaxID=2762756 RepID=A0ABR6VTA9_9BACT|nr:hypothetical protein [Rufibacter sediminis]MBC3540418.1 hypothetical protein [Rufibacter sediminis]
MKILVLIPLLFISILTFGQKSFVGQSKEKVKDYWSTQVSKSYWNEGAYDDQPDYEFFMICRQCGSSSYMITNPDFSADFKNGICVSNSYAIKSTDLSVHIARFNKQFKYNDKLEGWVDPVRKEIWKIEGSSGSHSIMVSKM